MGNLCNEWKEYLGGEFEKDYFKKLKEFLRNESERGKRIYPESRNVFNAFNSCHPKDVKVVIVGQDPYINEGEAMGLCFSVPEGKRLPPSLQNIFKEIEDETGIKNKRGDLTAWSKQGVMLLNSLLTVEEGKPLSHAGKGWEQFFNAVMKVLNEHFAQLIFVLWGRNAQRCEALLDKDKHIILKSSHPSPLGANAGFFGCGHFNEINRILKERGEAEISWQT